ncbi:MAG: prolyl oligopeptidase family serine peptidase [Anaerolineales bacterium]|nr:prolyl oligopeptidase family serine peptidase [Anaerolineales bacterium]
MSDRSMHEPQLLRVPFLSTATGATREYLLYLPRGYGDDPARRWPVILFLHGGGERGDGLADLDYVLYHGPLGEAWIRGRDLPFVMIAPQLPVFGMDWQLEGRDATPKPERRSGAPGPRPERPRPPQPMQRASDPAPAEYGITEAWGDEGFPDGWHRCHADLIGMIDTVLRDYRTDPDRVYLTGLSYGGNGTWTLATRFPDRWAAIAPICGDTNPAAVGVLAERQLPIWIFHGGRDNVIKPEWIYDVANALEEAGHKSVRLTIHEDLGHDCWSRVYAGSDLYDWFLDPARP